MKKILFLLVLSLLLFTGCNNTKKQIVEISYEDYNTKIDNKDSFVLYIGSANCSHCASFKPKLEDVVSKYGLEVYYVDVSKITEEEYAKLKNKVFLTGTPTLTYFENGTYSAEKIVGDKDNDEIISFFKTIKYIGD